MVRAGGASWLRLLSHRDAESRGMPVTPAHQRQGNGSACWQRGWARVQDFSKNKRMNERTNERRNTRGRWPRQPDLSWCPGQLSHAPSLTTASVGHHGHHTLAWACKAAKHHPLGIGGRRRCRCVGRGAAHQSHQPGDSQETQRERFSHLITCCPQRAVTVTAAQAS